MSEKIKIRNAVKEDVPLILCFIKELAEYEKLSEQVTATEEILRENLFGKTRYAEVLIAEYNSKPAGQALFFHNFSTFKGKRGIYLEDLYVKPELRGKGIGKALLNRVIETAKERNCPRIEWVVLDWNKSAMDFYENLGAEPLKEWIIYRLTEENYKLSD
jgi:GNAT superfamily N-acetyltransferase